jgi:hypothetical protein
MSVPEKTLNGTLLNLSVISLTLSLRPLPVRRKNGTPAHRQLSRSSSIAEKVSVVESFATPGSSRYPRYWPRITRSGLAISVERSAFTVSSRSRSGSNDTGGSIATKVITWNRCVEIMSLMLPTCS